MSYFICLGLIILDLAGAAGIGLCRYRLAILKNGQRKIRENYNERVSQLGGIISGVVFYLVFTKLCGGRVLSYLFEREPGNELSAILVATMMMGIMAVIYGWLIYELTNWVSRRVHDRLDRVLKRWWFTANVKSSRHGKPQHSSGRAKANQRSSCPQRVYAYTRHVDEHGNVQAGFQLIQTNEKAAEG